jgi:glycosyltransferase involved in cell wall biosynthesis
MISKALVVGAYQRKLEELTAQPDIELIAIVPPFWRQDGRRLELERAHSMGYTLIVAPMLLNGSYHAHCYPTLARLLRDARPDLVHVDEEPYNLATWQAVRIAQCNGVRSLIFSWQNLQRRYPSPFRQMEAWVLAHVTGALAGNQAAAGVLRAKGYAGPLRVLPQFGVDPDLYRPAPAAPPPDAPFTIGYAGRLVPEKGVDMLLEAAAGLSDAWRLQIYGSGPARDALRQQAAALGIADRTRFYDQVPSSEMPAHLAGLDALALPSRTRPNWMEQFGRVLIEAMACGVPVIGSSSGEIPNVIGDAGLIFAEGDALALRRHLVRLQADAALRRALATAGRARVLAHYTQAQIAHETAEFYRELCAQPAPPRQRG